ncbi:MAG TPA: dephospho-CoA kinase [Candidatus Limnocylindria bacterium]|nr:dephospho-CoA kinase [Candidatus Limnocylindria bacterium]
MRVLGLTGGLGSGKSTVSRMFADLGAEVIDADQLAREVVMPGKPALKEIVDTFGREFLRKDGMLDRPRLGHLIFGDPTARTWLNAITHPRIQSRMAEEISARESKDGILVLDIPLLYENRRTSIVEAVVVVWVDRATQIQRLVERDGLSEAEAQRRIAAQLSLDEKRKRADFVVNNTLTLEATREQVADVYRKFRAGPEA